MSTPAPSAALDPRRAWNRIATVTAIAFAAGSLPYLGCALTFGLVSGLVVLLAPLYVVLAQTALTVIAVSLALARRRPWPARVAGTFFSLAPALALDGWYAREWARCTQAVDSAACFEYLNGSPLLPALVVAYSFFSLVATSVVWLVARREAARAPASAPAS